MSTDTPAQEPIGFMSPKQVPRIVDPDDESAPYIPIRKTAKGNFTLALYAAPTQAAPAVAELVEVLRDCVNELHRVLDSTKRGQVHFDGDRFHERLTAANAALSRPLPLSGGQAVMPNGRGKLTKEALHEHPKR